MNGITKKCERCKKWFKDKSLRGNRKYCYKCSEINEYQRKQPRPKNTVGNYHRKCKWEFTPLSHKIMVGDALRGKTPEDTAREMDWPLKATREEIERIKENGTFKKIQREVELYKQTSMIKRCNGCSTIIR